MHQEQNKKTWTRADLFRIVEELNTKSVDCQEDKGCSCTIRPFRFCSDGDECWLEFLGSMVWESDGNTLQDVEEVRAEVLEDVEATLEALASIKLSAEGAQ